MKQMFSLLIRKYELFEQWFSGRFGWFFQNGMKRSDATPDR